MFYALENSADVPVHKFLFSDYGGRGEIRPLRSAAKSSLKTAPRMQDSGR
jgi:hypothetical protein